MKDKAPSRRKRKPAIRQWRDPVRFCSEVLHDPETGKPFVLYDAERDFLRRLFELTPEGRMRFTEGVFSAPKKSGKTCLAAMAAIYVATVLAGSNGEIYCLANDLEQSQSRVWAAIVQILEASPALKNSVRVVANKITFRATGTTITALPNDYRGFAGANPTLNIYDELAYYASENSRRLFEEGIPSPARKISFRLSVSTAGFESEPSPLRDLYDRAMQSGVEVGRDTRVHENLLAYWTHDCKALWQSQSWIDEMQRTLRAAQFARLIRNEWTASEGTFVELSAWDACVDPEARPVISDRKLAVWCGLDLGLRHDATALVVVAREGTERLRLIDHKIFIPTKGETLDIEATAETAIRELKSRFNVQGIAYDPWQGVDLSQRLGRAGVNMIKVDQNLPNLTMMAGTLLDLIKRRQIVLYPADDLRQAVAKTIAIESSRGWRLGKAKQSDRVDPIIALAMAAMVATKAEQPCRTAIYDFSGNLIYDSAAPPPEADLPLSTTDLNRNAAVNKCAGCACIISPFNSHRVNHAGRVLSLCAVCWSKVRAKDFIRA